MHFHVMRARLRVTSPGPISASFPASLPASFFASFPAFLFVPLLALHAPSAIAAISGSVSCSGTLTTLNGEGLHIRCAGALSLSDAVVSDPLRVVLEASGPLSLTRSVLQAPALELVSPQIALDSRSRLNVAEVQFLSAPAVVPVPLSPSSGSLSVGGSPLGVSPGAGASPGLIGGSPSGRSSGPLPPTSPRSGGSLQLGGGGPHTLTGGTQGGSAGIAPGAMASTVPEPSQALLFAAGMAVFMLRCTRKSRRR